MKELNCKDCIHHDACADWAGAIWDGHADKVMENEADSCAHYTDAEFAKRYWGGRLLKDIIEAVGDEGPSLPSRPA